MIEFLWPWVWFLLPLPYFIRRFAPVTQKQELALIVPFFARIKTIEHQQRDTQFTSSKTALWLAVLIWLLLLTAASRPQWVGEAISMPASARDIMMAVDISGSMQRPDLKLNNKPATRLDVIKHIVGNFVEQRKGDRLGLILFGTRAYLQAPLTFDLTTVNTLLDEAQIGMAGDATAIGDAIGLAIKRLIKQPDAQRVLILLSDGGDNVSEVKPEQAAELAAQEHIKIYTVGVGASEMVVRNFIFQQTVNPSQDLDEGTLRLIADKTGGHYFRAQSAEELQQIYSTIAQLEPIKQDSQVYRPQISLLHYPLALAFLLSLVMAWLWRKGAIL
jgi:Ca-activated chloride channel family protein